MRYGTGTIRSGLVAALFAAAGPGATAQSVAARTPNLDGGWLADQGVVQLNFLHRFAVSPAPLRKISNTPTFHVGTGLGSLAMVGFTYGSNSTLVPAYPNEWELFGRVRPLTQEAGAPVDLAIHAGYNVASESLDGELSVARGFGPLRLLAAARAFSAAFDGKESRYALAGGGVLRLTPSISVAGDYGVLLDRTSDESATWGAGLQLGVPYTPHSFSVHASNVGTASLEGASRGTRTRWGFEYTIPITLRRYVAAGRRREAGPAAARGGSGMGVGGSAEGDGRIIFIDIADLAYEREEVHVPPGTTVTWRNRDDVRHSVTFEDIAVDSGSIGPTETFSHTFEATGAFDYACTPHPFMQGRIVVDPSDREGGDR